MSRADDDLATDQQQRGQHLSLEKMWGSEPYWGLSFDWDPEWMLTDRHKETPRHADRPVPAGDARQRPARLGDGPDQRGPAPVRRQVGAAGLRGARLLEPARERARDRQRDQEAGRQGHAGPGREAAGPGGRGRGQGADPAVTATAGRSSPGGELRDALAGAIR